MNTKSLGRILLSVIVASILIKCLFSFISCGRRDARLADYVKAQSVWMPNDFSAFLDQLNEEQLLDIKKALNLVPAGGSIKELRGRDNDLWDIKHEIVWLKSNAISYWLIKDKEYVDYHELVQWVADEMDAGKTLVEKGTTFQIEREILRFTFIKIWDKLSAGQRQELLSKIGDDMSIKDRSGIALMSGSAALSALAGTVYFSGFAFYTTMSTVIYSAGSLLGVTLPFGAYSGASSTAAAVSGPIGLSVAAVAGTAGLILAAQPDSNQLVGAIIQIHSIKVNALKAKGLPVPE